MRCGIMSAVLRPFTAALRTALRRTLRGSGHGTRERRRERDAFTGPSASRAAE